jgi:hypothetical protein
MTDTGDDADLIPRRPCRRQRPLLTGPARLPALRGRQEIIAITWSPEILAEATEHLKQNLAGFDDAAAERLVRAMNNAFPGRTA